MSDTTTESAAQQIVRLASEARYEALVARDAANRQAKKDSLVEAVRLLVAKRAAAVAGDPNPALVDALVTACKLLDSVEGDDVRGY